MDLTIDWEHISVSQTEQLPHIYEISYQTTMQLCQCPFQGWNHLGRLHWEVIILIL